MKDQVIFAIFLVANMLSNCVNVFLYYFRYLGRNLEYLQRTLEQQHQRENIQSTKKWILDIHLVI